MTPFDRNVVVKDLQKIKEIKDAMQSNKRAFSDIKYEGDLKQQKILSECFKVRKK